MRTIFVGLFFIPFLILGLPFLGIEWVISKFNRPHADMQRLRMVQWGFRCISAIAGVKLTVKNEEYVPKDRPVLYIGNHRSYFDIIITYTRCPGLTGYISKSGIKKVPILRIWMKRLYCLFIDRDNPKEGIKVILTAIQHIRDGISICVFPEGTRNTDYDNPASLLPFKEGSFKIAEKTGCPIVPMVLTGTADLFEKDFPWMHRSKVTLTYGKPIEVASLSPEDKKHLGAYCQNVIQDMLNEEIALQKKTEDGK